MLTTIVIRKLGHSLNFAIKELASQSPKSRYSIYIKQFKVTARFFCLSLAAINETLIILDCLAIIRCVCALHRGGIKKGTSL